MMSPTTLSLVLASSERSIPYICGADVWQHAAEFVHEHFPKHSIVVVTDTNVATHYRNRLEALFSVHARYAGIMTIPAGEASKSRATKDELEDRLFSAKLGRDTVMIAAGGGVVGDLVGYVASTFHRGVPLIHLPTTLLAQVDSCIGGKTGINHPSGKNLIGTFYQPVAIFADIATLETLPDLEFYNGMAEVIKYAATLDMELWTYLETHETHIKQRKRDVLQHIIARSAELKIRIVQRDEREESGVRSVLNFGHTAGHAFEMLSNYQIPHGFAIASGMRVAARLSQIVLGYPQEYVERFDVLLERFHLKNDYSYRFSRDAIWHAITLDKKSREGLPRFTLMKTPTEYALHQHIDRTALEQALDASVVGATTPQLCVSVMPQYASDIVPMIQRAHGADLVEIRVDMIPAEEIALIDWEFIRQHVPNTPLIVTCRSRDEGGYFIGDNDERLAIYNDAMLAGIDWVDIEHSIAHEIIPELPIGLNTKYILSRHIIASTLSFEELRDILDDMTGVFAHVYKLVFSTNSPSDAHIAMSLIEYAKSRFLNVVIHAMGEFGEPSRIVGAVRGNAWTYLALDEESPTAPGQITLHEAKHVYFLHEKTAQTAIYGLLGYPVRHSKSKYLHNALYRTLSNHQALLYVHFPAPEAVQFWEDWHNSLSGLSITIPHKEAVFRLLDDISEEARYSGVCNTAVPIDGRWKGFNTDVLAIEDCLKPYQQELSYGVLIVGTGATTQSAIAALNRLGVERIYVIGRNRARVASITSKFRVKAVTEADFTMLDIAGIIQTTSLGMSPHHDEMPYGSELFRRGMIVMDVIYTPVRTRYIEAAASEGCVTITGDEMFIRQAAHQFQL
ncbi:MAG: 3-dehydroquinate synthase, partial [Candidatus Kapabacteria bacterium]|nr:3-dehydroquinate synthase [Candidatus Kapabacteria bacterium]